MKKFSLFIFALIIFNQCRYKDNDKISLHSVKKRLEKTWVLKEGIRDGNDLTSYYINEEITFSNVTNEKIGVSGTIGSGNYPRLYDFKHRKTIISLSNGSTTYELKITKLTNKELWMEGNCVGGFIGSSVNNIIKVKYSAK
jgi:hypothetical protein